MTDTKQATAEMVLCECGHDFVYHSYVPNCIHAGCICTRYAPRTQPSGTGDGQCRKCGRNNPVWFAPNEAWNVIKQTGILCPICFIDEAEKAGLRPTGWELRPEPSQTELRIPDDLRGAYDACNVILSTEGVDEPWVALCKRYIERIARLEGNGR